MSAFGKPTNHLRLLEDSSARFRFIRSGGQAGELLRSMDWSRHPLGEPEGWPTELKITLGILFESRYPMFLWWGPDLFQFYNDAYLPSFGAGKHPEAMGQKGRECWPEVWPIIWPQIEDVMSRGIPSWNVDQLVPIFRNGRIEDVYWTYGYSPVVMLDGSIGGTLVVCTETTSEVLARKAVEESRVQLKQSEERLSSAVEVARVGFYDWDIQNDRVSYSQQMMRDWGFEDTSTLGEALERIHPDDLAMVSSKINEAMENRAFYDVEYRVIRPTDRKTIWIHARGEVSHNAVGNPIRFFGTSLDITDRKVAEERVKSSERQLTLVTNALPVQISYLDIDRRFQFVNSAFEIWLDASRSEVIGKIIWEVIGEAMYLVFKTHLDRAYLGESVIFEQEVHSQAGDRQMRVVLTPDLDAASGEVRGIVTLLQDVSEQRSAQLSMENAIRARDEFLSIASHELKTPLTTIGLQTQITRRSIELNRPEAIDPARIARFVEHMDRSVKKLNRLVDDMLDISRLSSGKLTCEFEKFDLCGLVTESVDRLLPQAKSEGVAVSLECASAVEGVWDRFRIDQVVTNLLTNALRYGKASPVTVRVGRIGDRAWISVRDEGPGIDAINQQRIFRRFERAVSDDGVTGLGLGLFISMEIVQMHGGTIYVKSQSGQGADFVVELPLDSSQGPAHSRP